MNEIIEQVKFTLWSDPASKEGTYWRDVSSMAAFVGARLQHPSPPCNSRSSVVSTIDVKQYKEKFGDVRVYCSLAARDLVQERWLAFNKQGSYDDSFAKKWLFHDACHYRQCYMDMASIVPKYVSALTDAADYPELVQATFEGARALVETSYARLSSLMNKDDLCTFLERVYKLG